MGLSFYIISNSTRFIFHFLQLLLATHININTLSLQTQLHHFPYLQHLSIIMRQFCKFISAKKNEKVVHPGQPARQAGSCMAIRPQSDQQTTSRQPPSQSHNQPNTQYIHTIINTTVQSNPNNQYQTFNNKESIQYSTVQYTIHNTIHITIHNSLHYNTIILQ